MVVYVVGGASRGLGYAFVQELTKDPKNTVIGLVRDKSKTDARLAKDGITTVHTYQADITDFESLRRAAKAVEELTGTQGVDYLINNAAVTGGNASLMNMDYFEDHAEELEQALRDCLDTNVIGVVKTITSFLPLVKRSTTKKVITISSAMGLADFINEYAVGVSGAYSASKAAIDVLVAKYNVAYAPKGILFMGISPGFVDTNEAGPLSPETLELLKPMLESFKRYKPSMEGPITPQESVRLVLDVARKATIAKNGGRLVSHFGNDQWL